MATGLPEIAQSVEELRFLNNRASDDLLQTFGTYRKDLQNNNGTSHTLINYLTQTVIEIRDILDSWPAQKLSSYPEFTFIGEKTQIEKELFQKLDLLLWDCQERVIAMKDWSRSCNNLPNLLEITNVFRVLKIITDSYGTASELYLIEKEEINAKKSISNDIGKQKKKDSSKKPENSKRLVFLTGIPHNFSQL